MLEWVPGMNSNVLFMWRLSFNHACSTNGIFWDRKQHKPPWSFSQLVLYFFSPKRITLFHYCIIESSLSTSVLVRQMVCFFGTMARHMMMKCQPCSMIKLRVNLNFDGLQTYQKTFQFKKNLIKKRVRMLSLPSNSKVWAGQWYIAR